MRFLVIIISSVFFISGCSNIQKLTNSRNVSAVNVGVSLAEAQNYLPSHNEFQKIGDTEFYSFDSGTLVARDGVIISTILPDNNLTFLVTVDALSARSSHRKVAIFSGMPSMKEGSLEFAEVKKGIRFILEKNGYEVTEAANDADVFVSVSFGISEPDVDYSSYSSPVFGYDSGSSSYTEMSVNRSYFGSAATVTQGKGLYLQGYTSKLVKKTKYNRLLILRGLDAQAIRDGNEKELWLVRASSTGSSGDLRLVLPALLGASSHGINQHFKSQQSYRMRNTDLIYTLPLYSLGL